MRPTDEMPQDREYPSEQKPQRNAEGHFRFSACAIPKSDRNFTYAQGTTAVHDRLENNFETANRWRQFEQSRTGNGKESAHRIVHAGEWISDGRSRSRYYSPPERPARRRSTGDISASDYHVRCVGKQRGEQILHPFRRMTEVRIHHQKNFPLRGARTQHDRGSQSKFCAVLLDQTNRMTCRERPNHISGRVG